MFAGPAFCSETLPPLVTAGDLGKSLHQALSSSTEESVTISERQRLKVDKDSRSNAKTAPASVTSSSPSPFSSSTASSAPAHSSFVLQTSQCSMTKASQHPPIVYLPKLVYDIVTSADSTGLPKSSSLLPYHSVMWASSFRPLMSQMMTYTEQSLYYRQWTVPKPIHMDYNNRNEGRMDTFHPRRLLLSGPPQVCKKRRAIMLTTMFKFVWPEYKHMTSLALLDQRSHPQRHSVFKMTSKIHGSSRRWCQSSLVPCFRMFLCGCFYSLSRWQCIKTKLLQSPHVEIIPPSPPSRFLESF